MKKKVLIVFVAGIFFLSLAKVSLALDPMLDINSNVLKAIIKINCEKRQTKIEEKKATFEERKVKHMEAYNNLQDRLEKLSDKLSAKGYDVADLDADITVLDEKISKFETEFTTAFDKIKEAKNYVCDNHTGVENKNEMKAVRDLIKKVRQDSVEIRSYYKNTIRPDILAIKKQVPNQ